MKISVKSAIAACIFSISVSANAAILLSEVSSNAYITKGGYDIAWVSPCAQTNPTCGSVDYSYQSQFGWAAMTESLFNTLGISAYDFVFDGANVDYATGNNLDESTGAYVGYVHDPLNGDVAVATPWFSNSYTHIDFSRGVAGDWSFGDNNGSANFESLAYRVSSVAAVPEPSTIALMVGGLGLVGVAAARRKRVEKTAI